ncbi:MAG: hypothetical protein JSS27_15615 [Planctomycetes bacterium]|nr:hypothetical protein [Planctomycetota bacterium]
MPRPELPSVGAPNSSVTLKDDAGAPLRRRFFGSDGRAVKDIDYDHDHGAGVPHAHDWDYTKTPPRQPGRPVRPGE